MDEVLAIQEAVDILKRIPIANTRELKAVCMAVDRLEQLQEITAAERSTQAC